MAKKAKKKKAAVRKEDWDQELASLVEKMKNRFGARNIVEAIWTLEGRVKP
jgi:hypothetical protein